MSQMFSYIPHDAPLAFPWHAAAPLCRETQAEHLGVAHLCRWPPTGGHAGLDVALVKIVHDDVQCDKEGFEIEFHGHVSVGSCTSSLRIIPPTRESSNMPPLHHYIRGQCHDSTPLLLSASGLGTPVALCHVGSGVAKPQRASSTAAHYPQHGPTHTQQGASTVWRLDAQASLCPV